MDTRAPWARTREWARDWVGTLSFWAVTALSAVVALFVALVVTGDWSASAGWAVVGAPVGVGLAILWNWASTPWRDLQEVRNFLGQPVPRTTDKDDDPPSAKLQRYVQSQTGKLASIARDIAEAEGSIRMRALWGDFKDEADKTALGIATYEPALARYVDAQVRKANKRVTAQGPNPREDLVIKEAERVITAAREAADLYAGR